jgi:hypothetical protein
MSGTAIVIGLVTWAGGVIAWFVAALFEHRSRYARYKERKAEVQGACERDEDYKKIVGDIDTFVENQGAPRPSILHCAYFTAYQPLLTLAIIAIPTFRMWDFSGSIAAIINVFAMVGVLLLTIFHEYQGRDEYVHERRYRQIIWVAWVLYLVLILWLAHASEDSPQKEKNAPAKQTENSKLINPGVSLGVLHRQGVPGRSASRRSAS